MTPSDENVTSMLNLFIKLKNEFYSFTFEMVIHVFSHKIDYSILE